MATPDQPVQPDFNQLMEQAKEMQTKMKDIQDKITNLEVTGEAGGGLVKITIDGAHQAKKVEISPTLIGEEDDIDMLEDLIAAAINDASQKIESITKEEMVQMAKDMQLPEGMDDAGDAE
jgi:nucleoid-associated protein EbfC